MECNESNNNGLMLAFLTALVSGISVFMNGFVVKGFDPFVFTTLKNVAVLVLLGSVIYLLKEHKAFARLDRRQLLKLAAIGAIGGSVPFLLFFWGLSLSSGVIGSFIYRSLFIFASVFAFVFLKEKLNGKFIIGAALVIISNALMLGNNALAFGFPEQLVLLATILWAIEFNISKNALSDISPKIVAFGRMFFGSIVLLCFLAATGRLAAIESLSAVHWFWVVITSLFLLLYLVFWYTGLKHTNVSTATSILALGGPITALLSLVFAGKTIDLLTGISLVLTIVGVLVLVGLKQVHECIILTRKALN